MASPESTTPYRSPHGNKSPWELHGVKEAGLIDVTWDVSANDQHILAYFGTPSPEKYASEIVEDVKPGAIILLRDGHGTLHNSPKSDKSLTVQALPLIIEQLQAKGYQLSPYLTFSTCQHTINNPNRMWLIL